MINYKSFKKTVLSLLISILTVATGINVAQSKIPNPKSPIQIRTIDSLDAHPEFDVSVNATGERLMAGEETTLEFSILYGSLYGRGKNTGDPVRNLQVVYDRILEVFIVSEDMMDLVHTRPEDFEEITPDARASGRFSIRHTFSRGGRYRLVTCFSHRGQLIYKHFDVEVEGKLKAESSKLKADMKKTNDEQFNQSEIPPDPPFEKEGRGDLQSAIFNGYNVTLDVTPSPPVAGRKTKFVYHIKDKAGVDVNGIEVFMGTEMHLVTWRDDLRFFGYERTRMEEGAPGTVLVVQPLRTEMLYGTGILREILKNGKMKIEHGPIEGLLPAGKFPFKVIDKEANTKVNIGDWVEFWIVNKPETGLAITRIEPLAKMPTGQDNGVFQHVGNSAIYPGPDVVVEHTFPAEGKYMIFGQFKYEGEIITTRFPVDIVSPALFAQSNEESEAKDEDAGGGVQLTEQEQNGQLIYLASKSPSGGTIYIKQEDGSKFDASMTGITCVGCHGEDGRGGQEAGAITSDIRYVYLTKPYGISHPSGRKHPAYTDELLKQAITDGIDPADNKLDPTMVRWEMNDKDMDDLIAYIHRLSEMGKPGVTDEIIKIGCVLDMTGPLSATGAVIKEMIEATFEVINRDRKIYGRSLRLVVGDGGNDPVKSLAAARRLVEDEKVFCMIGNLGEAATKDVIPFLEEKGVALIAPLAPTYHQLDSEVTQNMFYLFPSPEYQAKVMIDYIMLTKKDKFANPGVGIIYANDQFGKAGLEAARKQLSNYRHALVAEVGYEYESFNAEDIVKSLHEKGVENVLVFTPDPRIVTIVAEADRISYSPRYVCNNMLLMPGILKIPRASERFLIVQNFNFSGPEHPACAEFLGIIRNMTTGQPSLIMQAAAFAGVRVLEEGLRLTGRDLTRRFFINGLEKVKVDTGLFGVISYGPGEHGGNPGLFIVKPDEQRGNFANVTKRRIRPTQKAGLY